MLRRFARCTTANFYEAQPHKQKQVQATTIQNPQLLMHALALDEGGFALAWPPADKAVRYVYGVCRPTPHI